MELRNLLTLLYTARDNFTSIEVAWTYWYNPEKMNAVMQRWASEQPPGSVTSLEIASGDETQATPQTWQFSRNLWWRKPDCWREDDKSDTPGHVSRSTTILCGGRWFSFIWPLNWLHTNVSPSEQEFPSSWRVIRDEKTPDIEDRIEGIPIVDPALLLGMHQLHIVEETTHAGRDAVRVRAVYRRGANLSLDGMFWSRADKYHLLVDKERGVLLRYAAVFEGEEFAVALVDRIVFDEPIPDAIFSLNIK